MIATPQISAPVTDKYDVIHGTIILQIHKFIKWPTDYPKPKSVSITYAYDILEDCGWFPNKMHKKYVLFYDGTSLKIANSY